MSRGVAHDRPRGTRAVAIGAPAVAAVALSLLLASSRRELDAELQLEADDRAVAGAQLPLRARLYVGLSRVEGPALAVAPCRVELRAEDGAVLARTWLRAGLGPSLEGAITVPARLDGTFTLHAVAAHDEQRVVVERALRIDADVAPPIAPRARALGPLRQLALGPLRGQAVEASLRLEPRVRGGVCIPEQPCELLVHVGTPAASLRLRATPSATPDVRSLEPSLETTGVVALQLTAHGPEAITELVASRAGADVASRSLRLPIALGSARALVPDGDAHAGGRPRVALAETGGPCIVDLFQQGRWQKTATLRDCERPSAAPFTLPRGLVRLQLRRDPFGSESAAVITLYARAERESLAEVLTALSTSTLRIDGGDAQARDYLLALHDEGLFDPPSAVSSLPRAQLELASQREGHRKLGLLVLALCAVALAALIAERGLSSSAQARSLLAAAGSDAAAQRRQRLRSFLSLVSTVAALLLVFALVAVYVIVRGRGALGP